MCSLTKEQRSILVKAKQNLKDNNIKQRYYDLVGRAISARTMEDIKQLKAEYSALKAELDGDSINMAFIIDTLLSKENTITREEQAGKQYMLTKQSSDELSVKAAEYHSFEDRLQKRFDIQYKITEKYISSIKDLSNAIDEMESSVNEEGKYSAAAEEKYFKEVDKVLLQNVDMHEQQKDQKDYYDWLQMSVVQIEENEKQQKQIERELELLRIKKSQEEESLNQHKIQLQQLKANKEIVLNKIEKSNNNINKISQAHQEKKKQYDIVTQHNEHKKQTLAHHINQYNQKSEQLYHVKEAAVKLYRKIYSIKEERFSSENKIKHINQKTQIKNNFNKSTGIDLDKEKNILLEKPKSLTAAELMSRAKQVSQNSKSADNKSKVEAIKADTQKDPNQSQKSFELLQEHGYDINTDTGAITKATTQQKDEKEQQKTEQTTSKQKEAKEEKSADKAKTDQAKASTSDQKMLNEAQIIGAQLKKENHAQSNGKATTPVKPSPTPPVGGAAKSLEQNNKKSTNNKKNSEDKGWSK